jgi:hypothetical protein
MTSPMPPSLPNGFANLSLNDRTVGEPFDVPLPFEEDFEVDEERGNNPYSDEEDSQDDENELRGARGTSYTIYHSQASKRFTGKKSTLTSECSNAASRNLESTCHVRRF